MYKKIIFIMLCFSVTGCNDKIELIGKKWYAHIHTVGAKQHIYKCCDAFIEFNKDGTYTAKGLIEEKGRWTFKKGQVILSEGGEFEITKLTNDVLELSAKDEKGVEILVVHNDECW